MELYNAIFYRKTIETYSQKPITDFLMGEVKRLCKNITYLNTNLNIKAHVVERGHLIHFSTDNKIKIKAPHYIVVTSNEGENYLENIGYCMESVVLEMTCLGLGTTWLKCILDRDDIEEFVKFDKIIPGEEKNIEYPRAIIGFGYPEFGEALFRSSYAIHDRHKMQNVCKNYDERWYNPINALRVAPSIRNSQPWALEQRENGVDLFEVINKKNEDFRECSKISMGVALKHFEIGCNHDNIEIEYKKLDVVSKRKRQYFLSVIEKNI